MTAGWFKKTQVLESWPDGAASPRYPYLHGGSWMATERLDSPDPLRGYVWEDRFLVDPLEPLQCYALRPVSVETDGSAMEGVESLCRPDSRVRVRAPGELKLDFGTESAGWLEFESDDLCGTVELSVSEYNRPGVVNAGAQSSRKTAPPRRDGNTWRLELNDDWYEGVRFGWLQVRSCPRPWTLRNLRLVCQIKPSAYRGSLVSEDAQLNRIWEVGAYAVRLNLHRDYFGSIMMERSDRHSWTGDAYVTQAASLAAFGNGAFVRHNTRRMQDDDNGIETYALYWVLALLDYVQWSGDAAFRDEQLERMARKLRHAGAVIVSGRLEGYEAFCGHDDRLGSFAEETPLANFTLYCALALRTATGCLHNLKQLPGSGEAVADLQAAGEYLAVEARRRLSAIRSAPGLHDGTERLLAETFSGSADRAQAAQRIYSDPVRAVSYSPFNGYFVLEGMAAAGAWDPARRLLDRCWGGMLRLGATTFWESFRPEWAAFMQLNDPLPCGTQGYTSLCHPWSSGPVRWLSDHLLGVRPLTPGYGRVSVIAAPAFSGSLCGEVPVPGGVIRVERSPEYVRVLLPEGCSGTGPAGEPLPAGESVLRLKEPAPQVSIPAGWPELPWQWLPDGRAEEPGGVIESVCFSAAPDGGELTTGCDGIRVQADVAEGDRKRTSLARREVAAEADVQSLFRGALRTRMPQPCQQTIRIDVDGALDRIEEVAVCCIDHRNEGIEQVIEVLERPGLTPVLPVRKVCDFSGGVVLRFCPRGAFRLRISPLITSPDATVSALVFRRKKEASF